MKHFPVLFLMLLSIVLCFRATQAQTVPNVCQAQLFLADINASGRLVTSGNNLVFIEDLPPAGWLQSSPSGSSQALMIDRSTILEANKQTNTVSIRTKRMIHYQARQEKFITFRLLSGDCSRIMIWVEKRNPTPRPTPTPFQPLVIPASHRKNMRPDTSGQLVIGEKMITFNNRRGSTFRWDFRDIKDLERKGSYFLEITPYSGVKFTFDLYGRGLSLQEFNALRDRILRN